MQFLNAIIIIWYMFLVYAFAHDVKHLRNKVITF